MYGRPPCEVLHAPGEHGTGDVRLELALDICHQLEPFLWIQLLRLRVHHAVEFLTAVVRVVSRGAAPVVLVEIRVRIVDAGSGQIRADLEVAAGKDGEPRARVDLLHRGFDAYEA